MSDRRFTNPRTGEVIDNPPIRPFGEILAELGEGTTASELSEGLWDLLRRVEETGKAGTITLTLTAAWDRAGRVEIKDAVKLKLPEFSRPSTSFFLDASGNATRRDPNQPSLPSIEDHRNKKENYA